MAQDQYAESRAFSTCDLREVIGGGAGYDWMQQTYTVKNDGWSWNNYWRLGEEFWQDLFCQWPNLLDDHVFQYFPEWLQTEVSSSPKPAFIIEADLFSPCHRWDNGITDKDSQAGAVQESLWRFISEERGADYIMAWLLTESLPGHTIVPSCPAHNLTNYPEVGWHEAYREDGAERTWFSQWWLRPEP